MNHLRTLVLFGKTAANSGEVTPERGRYSKTRQGQAVALRRRRLRRVRVMLDSIAEYRAFALPRLPDDPDDGFVRLALGGGIRPVPFREEIDEYRKSGKTRWNADYSFGPNPQTLIGVARDHKDMNNEHVDRLEEALRSVVEAAIAKELAPAQFEHAVLWWEPYSDSGSTGHTELRKATDYRSVGQMLYADPAMRQLRMVADDIRKIKWPEFLLDPTAENLCECYFSTTGSVAIDEAALRRVAQKYVTEVRAEDSVYVTVFQVEHFSAVEAFQLDDNIEFRRITDADIEHFGFEPLPVRQSPRLNKRDWICTVCQSYRADDISASHRSRDIWDVLIGSLGLSSEGNAWFSLLCEGPKSPFLSSRHYGSKHRMHSSPRGNKITLDHEGISRYKDTFARIKAICDQNTKNLVPSFRRFRAAAGREVMDDKLTDLVIALDSSFQEN